MTHSKPQQRRATHKEIAITPTMVGALKTGMYICRLDRPWTETPFLMQGFRISCDDEIDQIAHYCKYVYIDELKSRNYKEMVAPRTSIPMKQLFPKTKLQRHQTTTSWKKEVKDARVAIDDLSATTTNLMQAFRDDTPFDMVQIKTSVSPMVDSVLRNPDASMWLARIKDKDDYIYRHSVSCAIWAVAMGRQIGLPRHDLRTLALGALLFDIGKTKLPPELLTKKSDLSNEERLLIESHVSEGIKVVSEMNGVGPDVVDIIKHHHERHDGSGYPDKLSGNNIPILARIASIVDCYDAMTSERPYVRASSPSIVVRKLYAWRGKLFQAELVEEFIKAVGLYPPGTLVQLSTREVGIVTAENPKQRLRPTLMMLLDHKKQPLTETYTLNLATTVCNEEGTKLNIVKSLEPGSFGIDPVAVKAGAGGLTPTPKIETPVEIPTLTNVVQQ